MTQQADNKEQTTMENTARQPMPTFIKRANNVIGLFPGVLPGPYKKNTSSSLTVCAARLMLASFVESLESVGIGLIVSDEALAAIVKAEIDTKYGAKPLKKIIEMRIEFPLSQALLKRQFVSGHTITVHWSDGATTFTK